MCEGMLTAKRACSIWSELALAGDSTLLSPSDWDSPYGGAPGRGVTGSHAKRNMSFQSQRIAGVIVVIDGPLSRRQLQNNNRFQRSQPICDVLEPRYGACEPALVMVCDVSINVMLDLIRRLFYLFYFLDLPVDELRWCAYAKIWVHADLGRLILATRKESQREPG